MHNSRNDQIVRFTGWFANVQRLRNITGATVFCQQPLRNPPRSRRPPCRRRVQDLAEFGIGHKLYFAFLRNTALAFTALSAALAAPLAALYLAHGTFFAADGLPRISLGNYGPLYEEGAARAADGVRPIHFFWSSAAAALCAKRARPAQPTGCAPSTFFKVRFEVTDDMPERATAEAPSTFAPEYLCTRVPLHPSLHLEMRACWPRSAGRPEGSGSLFDLRPLFAAAGLASRAPATHDLASRRPKTRRPKLQVFDVGFSNVDVEATVTTFYQGLPDPPLTPIPSSGFGPKTKPGELVVLAYLDCLVSILLFCGCVAVAAAQRRGASTTDVNVVTISDFSVQVSGLPDSATADEARSLSKGTCRHHDCCSWKGAVCSGIVPPPQALADQRSPAYRKDVKLVRSQITDFLSLPASTIRELATPADTTRHVLARQRASLPCFPTACRWRSSSRSTPAPWPS